MSEAVAQPMKTTSLSDLLDQAVEKLPRWRKRSAQRRLARAAKRAEALEELQVMLADDARVQEMGIASVLSTDEFVPEQTIQIDLDKLERLLQIIVEYLPLILQIILPLFGLMKVGVIALAFLVVGLASNTALAQCNGSTCKAPSVSSSVEAKAFRTPVRSVIAAAPVRTFVSSQPVRRVVAAQPVRTLVSAVARPNCGKARKAKPVRRLAGAMFWRIVPRFGG